MKRKRFGRKEEKKEKEIKKKERHMQWILSKLWEKEENQKIKFKKKGMKPQQKRCERDTKTKPAQLQEKGEKEKWK